MSMTIRKATRTIENVELIAQKIIPNSRKEISSLLPKVRGKTHKETCQKLYQYCRLNFKYTLDKPGLEEIRSPAQTIKDRKADCEDYAIFISACLLELNYPATLRIVDYGDGFGWSHIYVVSKGIIIDPVNPQFNQETKAEKYKYFRLSKKIIMKNSGLGQLPKIKQYTLNFPKNGLGKLPQNLISDREKFILALWYYFIENGATYQEENQSREFSQSYSKGYKNTLPQNIKSLNQLVETLNSDKFGVNAELIKEKNRVLNFDKYDSRNKERIIKIPEVVKINLGKQTFTFDPYYLADSVYRVYGIEGLSPKSKSKSIDLSPFNEKLMTLLKPFASTDQLRPGMTGVSFSKDGICATDGHVLAWIQVPSTYNQIYNFKGNVINENFPNYVAVVPTNYKNNITVNTTELKIALNQALKYTNKTTRAAVFGINYNNDGEGLQIFANDYDYENGVIIGVNTKNDCDPIIIGFNVSYFLKIVNILEKLKIKDFTMYFSEVNRASVITVNTEYGKMLLLLMPIMVNDDDDGVADYVKKFNERLKMLEKYRTQQPAPAKPTENKAFIMARAKAKLRLLALKF